MPASIDINCDLGEGCANDAELMRYISSASIACGFHAGDEDTMRLTVDLAIQNNVAIGAHPGFPDRENFGRTEMKLLPDKIHGIITEQVAALKGICDDRGAKLHHVKPHGALYNMAAKDLELACAIAKSVAEFDKDLVFFGLANSYMISEAEALGLRTAAEVFADRTYQPNGTLTPRSRPDALIGDPEICKTHVLRMVRDRKVIATDGTAVPIHADTICIHGDGPHAVSFAAKIRDALQHEGIVIKPPVN
jgi:5-oxoprolinase (ATP-hydrolysing) subunit A